MTLRRIPIGGWKKCVYEAAAFDSKPEYNVADILDSAQQIDWWLRNDPPILRLPTPIGYFEPDFLYRLSDGTDGLLEVKGDIFWDGPGSDARIKGEAGCAWCSAVTSAKSEHAWEFLEVLEHDALEAQTLEELRAFAVLCFPQP